ncbi:phosphatase PAP2 family protein [Undibacterium sp. TJN19]|uniref:phosphatase PAP2 family protein n=1 Tax=Undibacterium sp. TJN19 TaxID=3413055 RepID=UPI003BF2E5B5
MHQIENLNQLLFLQWNATDGTPQAMISIAIFIADALIFLLPLLLLAFWLWGGADRRRLALQSVLVCLLALGLGQLVTLLWQHPRPFMIGVGHTWTMHAADASFPSDHGTVFASIALCFLIAGESLWGCLLAITGVAVACSRIFLGVHFPFDMVGAVLVALLAYALMMPLWAKWGITVMAVAERFYHLVLAWPIARGWVRR